MLGGSLFRIGLGALPFLLPLMLQEGHGMSAFQSGLITCASAFGGMFMRTVASTRAAALRVPLGAGGQRGVVGHLDRGVRAVFSRHADLDHLGGRVARRLLPRAAIHESEFADICGNRQPRRGPRHESGQRRAADVARSRRDGRRDRACRFRACCTGIRASRGRISGRRFWWSGCARSRRFRSRCACRAARARKFRAAAGVSAPCPSLRRALLADHADIAVALENRRGHVVHRS